MTQRGKERGMNALLNARTYGNRYFTRVWVVKDSVYFTRNAARRAEEFEDARAEELTLTETCMFKFGTPYPPKVNPTDVDENIDQRGDVFANGLYSPIKFIPFWKRKK